jgi:hypothetical protein
MAAYVLPKSPDLRNSAEVTFAAIDALDRYHSMVWRVLAMLAKSAEQVETAVGLERREEPKPPDPWEAVANAPRGRRDPAATGMPVLAQLAAAAVVMLVWLGGARAFTAAGPRYAVLPRHDYYRPTVVPDNWTPPARGTVWDLGFRPYHPGMPGYENPHDPTRFSQPGWSPRGWNSPTGMGGSDPRFPQPGQPGYDPYRPGRPRGPVYPGGRPYQGPAVPTPGPGYRTPGYPPPGGYQPPRGYQPPSGYQPPGGYQPPSGYQPPTYQPPTYQPPPPPPR